MTESAENYLEAILVLEKQLPVVRAVNIAKFLEISPASVSVAIKQLREAAYIVVNKDGYILLSKTGKQIAETIYERHEFFSSWLESLGVSADVAARDACKIEHVISKESFKAVKEYIGKKN